MNTLDYYDQNATEYFNKTVNADMQENYRHFLPLVQEKGRILDLGCGSGRDSLFFKKMGYEVVAVDGSKKMCELAQELLQQPVINLRFDQISFKDTFDGIWACASLLHVKKVDMPSIMKRIESALKENGVFYCSYKYGNQQRISSSREFSDYNEEDLNLLFADFEIVEYWVSQDVLKGREQEKWLNVICRKKVKE